MEKCATIEIDLGAYRITIQFADKAEPLAIHFDTPSRRFYFALIALVVNEMKKPEKPGFIHVRKHQNILQVLDKFLSGKHASRDVESMWAKINMAWRYRLPDLEAAALFKVLDRNLIPPYEKGGKYRYNCTDEECDTWANLFGYDEHNKWRFKFAVDSVQLKLDQTSLVFGKLHDNQAFNEYVRSVSRAEEKPAITEETTETAKSRRWSTLAVAIAIVIVCTFGALVVQRVYFDSAATPAEDAMPAKPSLAVMPFDNFSDDPDTDYFSDGITDDLITDLSKISGLLVIARNSTFTYKGKFLKAQQIAQELGVQYILEGSVRKDGVQVRINAQLIDAKTGHHMWAERYDSHLDDVFAIQDQITRKIVAALTVTLTTAEKENFSLKETDSLEAYDAFLHGWQLYLKKTSENLVKAIPYFEKAIALDPDYGRAYAALALTYWRGSGFGWAKKMGMSHSEARFRARHYLEKALKNPTPTAYRVASDIAIHRRNYQEAFDTAQKAITLDPNDSQNHLMMARVLHAFGEPEEAIGFAKRAMLLNPLDTAFPLWHIGYSNFLMGQYEEAVKLCNIALEKNPTAHATAGLLAVSYGQLGQTSKAQAALEIYHKGWVNNPSLPNAMYFHPFKKLEHADRFAEGFLKAGMPGKVGGYYKILEKLKLTTEEIRSVFFGKKAMGGWGKSQWEILREKDGNAVVKWNSKIIGRGKSWAEKGAICHQWEKLYGGFRYCQDVYRNPEGTSEEKNEYILIDDRAMLGCSVQ